MLRQLWMVYFDIEAETEKDDNAYDESIDNMKASTLIDVDEDGLLLNKIKLWRTNDFI